MSSGTAGAWIDEWDGDLRSADPLGYPGYAEELARLPEESVRTGVASFGAAKAVVVEFCYPVRGGTMGVVAGERIVRAYRRATDLRLPVVGLVATGGARMQEGTLSLLQMGRTVDAQYRHAAAGLLSTVVLRSPTTGGVYASWASLADVRAAHAGAVVGFGGPRVVESITGARPPSDSHTAESAYRAGLVDQLVDGRSEYDWVRGVLGDDPPPLFLDAHRTPVAFHDSRAEVTDGADALRRARAADRPSGLEWAAQLCSSWVELRGADPTIRVALAGIGGDRVVVVAMDRHAHRDGRALTGPSAFRTARRGIALAERLGLPILTLVDTPSADPGPRAEADGIAAEIAATLRALAATSSRTVSVCVGEGGSGAAMALSYTDRSLMLADSVFSVIGPEAASAILHPDRDTTAALAAHLRITASDAVELGFADTVIRPAGTGDDVASLTARYVTDALGTARPGDRHRRGDRATELSLL